MAAEQTQTIPKREMARHRGIVWALIVIALGCAVVALIRADQMTEKARRINCAGNLKGLGLASRAYAADYDACFPDDLSLLMVVGWMPMSAAKVYTCPNTRTTPAGSLEQFRAGGHCDYLYLGKGLTEKCRGLDPEKVILGCDKPGNHRDFFNVWVATGYVRGYAGSSIEEIADRNGLFLPGYNLPAEKTVETKPTP